MKRSTKRFANNRIRTTLFAVTATLSLIAQQASAASATGTAVQVVITAISIANVSNLDFGTAPQGDVAKTVVPSTSENATNGSFTVTGQASTAYTISLPADGVVSMIFGAGGANQTIAVNTFVSYPAVGANGLLSVGGTQSLFIGATRAALGAAQVAGSYSGTYTVTVIY